MKRLILMLSLVAVGGCATEPMGHAPSGNKDLPVAIIGVVDGLNIYRFMDAGHWVYFVAPNHGPITTTQTYCQQTGKTCANREDIVLTELR